MEQIELYNQRKVTLKERVKQRILLLKYRKGLYINGRIKILGKLPILKIPENANIIIGDKVVLNSDFNNSNTALTYKCTLSCGFNGVIEIGDNTMLNGVAITAYEKVTIGKNCQIASNTIITDTDYHPVDPVIRLKQVLGYKYDFDTVSKKGISIGDNVWIGWGTIVLKGVSIGNNSIIAAGSVVIHNVPPNVLVAGNPATVKKIYG